MRLAGRAGLALIEHPCELDDVLIRVLNTAIMLTQATFGNIQLSHPETGALYLVRQSGHNPPADPDQRHPH